MMPVPSDIISHPWAYGQPNLQGMQDEEGPCVIVVTAMSCEEGDVIKRHSCPPQSQTVPNQYSQIIANVRTKVTRMPYVNPSFNPAEAGCCMDEHTVQIISFYHF